MTEGNPRGPRLSSRRPYLLRAMRDWMVDNGLTPHIVVDAHQPGVQVPDGFVRDGRIILNVSDSATEALHLGNDVVAFSARFGGSSPRSVSIPVQAVLGIYARETEQGMVFGAESPEEQAGGGGRPDGPPDDDPPGGNGPASPGGDGRRASHLKVVK